MKLKCIDGVVREFEVRHRENGQPIEASCKDCGMTFGYRSTRALKPTFIRHTCNSEYRKLKPCWRRQNDEIFSFMFYSWNITEMQKYAESKLKPRVMSREEVKKYYENFVQSAVHIEDKYLDNVDINKPGLMAQISEKPSSIMLVDGNHRLTKAYKKGEGFKVYQFTFAEQIRFMATPESQESIIKYNNRMKELNS